MNKQPLNFVQINVWMCVCVCVCVCVCMCVYVFVSLYIIFIHVHQKYQIDKIFRNYLLTLRNGLSQIVLMPSGNFVLLMLDTDNWLSVRISNYYYGVQGFIEIPSMLLKDSSNRDLFPFLLNCKTQNSNNISFTISKKIKSNCYFIICIKL